MTNGMSSRTIAQLATLTANTVTMSSDISDIKEDIKDLKGQYVTQDQFIPIRNLVYGFVGLILVLLVGAMVSFFIWKPNQAVSLPPATVSGK